MSVYDPVYNYLLNGLNLANLNLVIGHTDHPGTPLQILVAIIIRITYLFRDNNTLVNDVLLNPELYLHNVSITLISINTVALFLAGYINYRIFKDLPGAIFIQLSLFFSKVAAFFMSVVLVEPMLVFTELVMIIFIFQYLHEDNKKQLNRYSILFAIVSGFGLANKVVFFPVVLIPFLLLKGFKARVRFALTSVAAFFVFIIPALSRFNYFLQWIKKLVIFTGKYGSGEPSFINTNEFIRNLLRIFKDEYIFTIVYAIIILTIGLYLLRRYRKLLKGDRYFRLLVIIFIAVTLQIIVVAKHYSHHYMIPAHILIATSVFLIVLIIKKLGINASAYISERLLVYIVILSGFLLIFRLIINYHFSPGLNNPRKDTVSFVKINIGNQARILVNNKGFESAFMESALYLGMNYSGNQKHMYGRTLKKAFPHTYFYNIGTNEFNDWQTAIPSLDIASHYNNIILYLRKKDNDLLKRILDNFSLFETNDFKALDVKEIYENNITNEVIYELGFDSHRIKSSINIIREIKCDCESTDNTYFISSDGDYHFDKGNLQNNEIYFSESHSIKLTDKQCYGLGVKIKIKQGDIYKINIWRLSENASGIIVATTDIPGEFYKTGSSIQQTSGAWEKIELNVEIPGDLSTDTLHIYLWNNVKDKELYFDDFIIYQAEFKK